MRFTTADTSKGAGRNAAHNLKQKKKISPQHGSNLEGGKSYLSVADDDVRSRGEEVGIEPKGVDVDRRGRAHVPGDQARSDASFIHK